MLRGKPLAASVVLLPLSQSPDLAPFSPQTQTTEMSETFNELFPQDLAKWMEEEVLINRSITPTQVRAAPPFSIMPFEKWAPPSCT